MEEAEGSEGQGMGVLKNLIILAIVIIILLFFTGTLYTTWRERSDLQICRDSIELHAAGKLWGLKSVSEAFRCPPKYITIKTDDQDKAKKQIADSMAECFWKFGENKYDLFSGRQWGQETFCALCSHIKFENRNMKLTDFRKYILTTPVPSKYGQGSYASYVLGRPTNPVQLDAIPTESTAEIDGAMPYGVMFLYGKNEHVSKWLSGVVGMAIGSGGGIGAALYIHPGVLVGAGIVIVSAVAASTAGYAVGSDTPADWQSAVVVIPYDYESLNKLGCTQLPIPQGNKE